MVDLASLWLPILVAAVLVFVASSVIHMMLPIHKGDYGKLPGEEQVLAAMREQGVAPGSYMLPCASSMKEYSTPTFVERLERGPVGFLTVVPSGKQNMGKSLGQWFGFCIVVSVFAAYLGRFSLPAGTGFGDVFRVTAAVGVLGYAFSNVTESIWKGVSWGITAKFLFDGIVYGVVTGLAFGWLWP